ncbi:MAG: hypothetical protein UT29_C0002G0014 [Candidatus Yanofskybacteria bacterium GW2011_GWA1_39_13]|uniref:Uncharacterized protein n=1 Tax=Yanofskybacteria sp. (strain GW2011_GWA1_39_13) TaxID=1619019 RepID=A0A0G0QL76_YANXG|nr:MAG: hypothetical protein UT29_C0002G0014 [Candidatus Yanofskybacteria bacterium GW2011_GWA1_39_13]
MLDLFVFVLVPLGSKREWTKKDFKYYYLMWGVFLGIPTLLLISKLMGIINLENMASIFQIYGLRVIVGIISGVVLLLLTFLLFYCFFRGIWEEIRKSIIKGLKKDINGTSVPITQKEENIFDQLEEVQPSEGQEEEAYVIFHSDKNEHK